MASKIQFKRGVKANLPTLSVAEPAFTTDTNQFFIGNGTTNIELAKSTDLSEIVQKDYIAQTTFKNSWIAENNNSIIKNGNIVNLDLNISGGIITNGTVLFTLPSILIPDKSKNILAFNYGTPWIITLCAIDTNGNCILYSNIANNLSLRFNTSYCIKSGV